MKISFFKEEDLKHLPFNYRHVQKYDEVTLPSIEENDAPSGFNYVVIKCLQTKHHMVGNIYKPISRLFSNYDTKK